MASVTMQRNREWFHLAATWDIKSREIICYKDGIRQDQVGFFNGPIGVSDQHLNLGRIERRGNRYCGAGFSEFRIWDRVRSGEEIRAVVAYIGTLSKLGPNDPEPPLPSDVTSSDLSTPTPLNRPASQPITDNQPLGENHSSVMTGDPEKGKLLFFDLSIT